MISLDFDWQTNEFMLYCRTTQLREKSMMAYEQSLKLFQRWCMDEMGIFTVDKVPEDSLEGRTASAVGSVTGPSPFRRLPLRFPLDVGFSVSISYKLLVLNTPL